MSSPATTRISRPVLRYHGGKWKLGAWIIQRMPTHRFYVEPFGGSASVLMQKPRSYGDVYNDLDGDIVSLFRVLRDEGNARELTHRLELTPFAREEFSLAWEHSDDPVEAARRLIIKSFMGFGTDSIWRPSASSIGMRVVGSSWKAPTGMRTCVTRRGSTPATDWARYPSVIERFTERLRGVVIENRDACEVMRQHDGPDTLHYVDPPYLLSTRTGSHGYRHELTDADHAALANFLHALEGAVMLSGYPSILYDEELYPDWERVEVPAHAQGAVKRTEVMWMNAAAVDRAHGLFSESGSAR